MRYLPEGLDEATKKNPQHPAMVAGLAKSKALRSKYLSLASGNPNIPADLAVRMLGYISNDDVNHATCKAVSSKLVKLNKTSSANDL